MKVSKLSIYKNLNKIQCVKTHSQVWVKHLNTAKLVDTIQGFNLIWNAEKRSTVNVQRQYGSHSPINSKVQISGQQQNCLLFCNLACQSSAREHAQRAGLSFPVNHGVFLTAPESEITPRELVSASQAIMVCFSPPFPWHNVLHKNPQPGPKRKNKRR